MQIEQLQARTARLEDLLNGHSALQQRSSRKTQAAYRIGAVSPAASASAQADALAAIAALERRVRALETRLYTHVQEAGAPYHNAPCGYHALDADGTFRRISRVTLGWLGYMRHELIGRRRFVDLLTPSSRPVVERGLATLAAQGWLNELEADIVTRDGRIVPVSLRAHAIVDDGGQIIGSRWTMANGSTHWHAQREQPHISSILEHTSDGIGSFGFDQSVIYLNRRARELLGLSATEDVTRLDVSDFLSPAMYRHLTRIAVPLALAVGRWAGDVTLLHCDGHEIQVSMVLLLQHSAADSPDRLTAIMRDVSPQKPAAASPPQPNEASDAASAALRDATRLKHEFMATMSHELRTPLNSILGLAEALQLQTYGPLTERQEFSLKLIEASGRELLELVNDLLDLSRIEAGQLHLHKSTFDIVNLARLALERTASAARDKGQSVHFTASTHRLMIEGDQRRCMQILINLISNAIKFTPKHGELGVNVEVDEETAVVHIQVWDHGIGIAQEDLSRLFLPFTQLDGALTRHYPGAGLGLALTKRLAELHDGALSVQSELKKGSTFSVALPYQKR